MAHKTLIGGTAYEISGGKTLVGGTAYSIKNGKTLVGGTAYEVGFDDGMRNITIVCEVDMLAYAAVTVDGTKYVTNVMGGTTELNVPVGTNIECYVRCYTESAAIESGVIAKIIVNGNVVAQSNKNTTYYNTTYNYIVTDDAIINLEVISGNGTLGGMYGLITITEQ